MKAFFLKYKNAFFKFFLFATLVYFPIFLDLDSLPVRIWDESRLAINAYEMNKDGDFLVTHFQGQPDMWNTKPPLMIWLQVFFSKILGIGELSLRLPSAFASFFVCLVIMLFSIRYINYWFGLISVLILITTHGYINLHASRTGDYDALLTFFTTASSLSFFAYCEKEKNNRKYLYFTFIFLALAVLTKSVQALFFVPGWVIYLLIRKQAGAEIKNKHFWLVFTVFIVFVSAYYFLREHFNPGYLKAVWENELGGRFLVVNEGHEQGFWYYYLNFISFQFTKWYFFIPCAFILTFFLKNQLLRRFALFMWWLSAIYFIVISSAQTKLEWYDVPLYPFLAALCAIPLWYIFEVLKESPITGVQLKYNMLPFIFLFFVCLDPYKTIINKVYKPVEYSWDKDFYQIEYFLQDAVKGKRNLTNYFLCSDNEDIAGENKISGGYNTGDLFYLNIINDKGGKIDFKDWEKLELSDKVIAHQDHVKKYIESNYSFIILENYKNVRIYKITGHAGI